MTASTPRLFAVPATLLLLAACSAPRARTAQSGETSAQARTTDSHDSAFDDAAALPSLADQAAANDATSASAFAQSIGVRIEEQPTELSAPDWFAAAATAPGRAAGTALGEDITKAINAAATQAGRRAESMGVNAAMLRVERAAWKRLPTGQYVAWAAIGNGSDLAPLPASAVTYAAPDAYDSGATTAPVPATEVYSGLPTLSQPTIAVATGEAVSRGGGATPVTAGGASGSQSASKNNITDSDDLPSLSAATTAQQSMQAGSPASRTAAASEQKKDTTPLAPAPTLSSTSSLTSSGAGVTLPVDSGAPSWWTADAATKNNRTVVGIRAEGNNRRDAALAALAAGRERLASILGQEPKLLLTDRSQMVTRPDGSIRIYSLMSCTAPTVPVDAPK